MRAFATALSLLLTSSILPLSSPLLGQPVPVRAFDVPSIQPFDALGPDGVVAPLGWRAGSSEATLTRTLGTGSVHATAPGAYNVPGADQNDRAVGFLQGKGRAGIIDVRLRNATGSSIDAISIAFDAVQWRFSSDTRAQSGLELLFSADGATFVSLGDRFSYHAVAEVDIRPLVSRNQSVRVVARVSGRWILPSLLPPGAEFLLRWRSTNSQIEGVGFALDNVRLEAHPVLPTADGDGFVTLHNPLLHDSKIFFPGRSQPVVLRMRGRPGGPLAALTIEAPRGWSIGPAATIELDGPAFERAQAAVEENRVVIRNASLTDTQTGSVHLGESVPPLFTLEAPAVFRVFTSTSDRDGKEIQESPKAVPLRTIESVRQSPRPSSNREEIAVEGSVLCPYSLHNTQGEFFLDQKGSGIRVIFEEQDLEFSEGQKLLVCGWYVEDRASPAVLVTEVYEAGTGQLMSRRPSALREVITAPREFEGSLVILRNVRKVRATTSPWPPVLGRSPRYFLTDGEGRDSILLAVHPSSGLGIIPEPKYPLTLRGIVTRRNGDGVPSGRLMILPRFLSDINPVLTPAAPEPRSPAHGEEHLSLIPTLEWEVVGDVSYYHLQLSTDSTFTSMVAEDSLLTESFYRPPQLASEADFYWRVRALNADGAGPFSKRRRFSTIEHPTVRILDPGPGEFLGTSSVNLRVARSGFWYGTDRDVPDELFENQRGSLKICVGGEVQGYVERDSLWIVRLARGRNVVTTELVDRERRPLRPPVMDSTVLTVSEDAWIVRAYTGGADASIPIVHHSSSLRLDPEVSRGGVPTDRSDRPGLAVIIDGRPRPRASAGSVSVTGLVPGEHRIRVELVNSEGAPLNPRVFDEFSVAVPDSAPYLKISSPFAGDTLGQAGGSLVVERRNLHLQSSSESVAGGALFGAFLLSVNGVAVDTSDHDTLSVGRLSPGSLVVRVEALDLLGVPFQPAVFDEVQLVVRSSVENAELLDELDAYVLEQNYPNPFNAETEIRFSIPVGGPVTVRVFNLLGQEVALLLDSDVEAGTHRIRWNGLNDSGKRVSTGIYMVRLESGPYVGTRRMLLVK